MSSLSYNARQSAADSTYRAAYTKWLDGLSPAERARVEAMNLGEPDTADRIDITKKNATVNLDTARELHPEQSDVFIAAMTEAMSELCHWFTMPPGQRGLNAKAIGCRVIMAMWVMRPDIIGNLSLPEIGALVDARPEVLSRQASAFSKRFGIRGRMQFSEKARKAQSVSAKRRNAGKSKALTQGTLFPADPSLN